MSGSQHNPNGRQAQLGSSWSPLQLQMANLLARAPQAHMASERGVTWHTPTPPPHLYHVPQPSPPDPLQAMKGAGNSVFRHTATPPELYRHTPTPPDKHLLRHTPSPGDVKSGAALPPADLYAHLGPGREKLMRGAELLPAAYSRGVDLSVGTRANGAALSVRDAPTINSLIARAPRHHRVDELLERLAPAPPLPAPVSPHSVIVTARAAPTPSPPSSNEDSADSGGAPKRKRKPERTIRVPSLPLPLPLAASPPLEPRESREVNGSSPARNGPELRPEARPQPPEPPVRRKTRSGSAETIDDIAAMIASTEQKVEEPTLKEPEKPIEPPVTIDKLKSVLASDLENKPDEAPISPPKVQHQQQVEEPVAEPAPASAPSPPAPGQAAAPRRRPRAPHAASANVPVQSPSEGKPAEPAEPDPAHPAPAPEPAASFVEVENQLEKMFAGIEEPPRDLEGDQPVEKEKPQTTKARKRRKSAPTKGERKAARRASRADTYDKKKKKGPGKKAKETKDAYDSGSNASSGRSRGPYIQIRGPRDSPLSVSVINAATGEDEEPRRKDDFRNGLRTRGLHCSTLGLRYDATTPDATWLCVFCERGPHAAGLGDLFGPYPLETDCEEYRALDEATRRKYEAAGSAWLHEACAVWAPGLLAAGARLWGLASAVWSCRGTRCMVCSSHGAGLACGARGCRARAHVPCARAQRWTLDDDLFKATCVRHAEPS
ncbi:serine/arginine repetitive matrix protein 1 isoform X2 [Leguminivora glycinivorella]|uniref:serine/arginine repetitive matrix protein 1 isoform X2 n=1 Tax=Leguminivora glycinivorella TaxID=1035111 RepID=UPI00200C71B4|nr:serine/arginine repetitive matrix protein 1 isoform X2 [Leguminivora glycinivorella]